MGKWASKSDRWFGYAKPGAGGGGAPAFIDSTLDAAYAYGATDDPISVASAGAYFTLTHLSNSTPAIGTWETTGGKTLFTPAKTGLYQVHFQATFEGGLTSTALVSARFESANYSGWAAHELRAEPRPAAGGTDILQAGVMYLNAECSYHLRAGAAGGTPTWVYADLGIVPVLV